jgi:hypothetical protein
MKIAIIGTSNAIVKGGYSQGIADHSAVTEIGNYSLGASTSVMLPKMKDDGRLLQYDYVVIDFSLNEEFLYSSKSCTLKEIEERFLDFAATLPLNGPVPVIAILPSIEWSGKFKPVRETYMRIGQRLGILVIDGYEFLDSHGYIASVEDDGAFMDPMHMRREIGHEFGSLIAETIQKMQLKRLAPHEEAMIPNYEYVLADMATYQNGVSVRRRSSIVDAVAIQFRKDGSLTFDFDECVQILGVGTNNAETNCIVNIEANSLNRKVYLKTSHYKPGNNFLIYAISPFPEFSGKSFRFTIADDEPDDAVIEIVGVTVRRAATQRPIPRFSTMQRAD